MNCDCCNKRGREGSGQGWPFSSLVEIYRSEEAYKAHLATPHFRKYKDGTPHMIKPLELVPRHPLDPEHANGIFWKWL